MDEFIVLLVIAFVILGALMVFGTPLMEIMGSPQPKGNVITEFSLGRVGYSESEVYRTITFGSFGLGHSQEETLRSLKKVGVSKGYFGEDSKAYEVDTGQEILNGLKDVKISFNMGETNLLGNLVIKWNDVVVMDKVANLNRYSIKIDPEFVAETNNLEISAANPGIYFWAANTYSLEDLDIVAEYGPEKFFSFEIYPNELEAWNTGTLSFYTTSGNNGELSIKLNGMEIFRQVNPEHLTKIDMKFSDIANKMKIGENVLSLKADNPFDIDDMKLDISLSSNSVPRERDFEISDELNTDSAEVIFEVDSIYKAGTLSIKINNNELNIQNVRTGENTIDFDPDYLQEGKNIITFSGTGSWEISNVKIVA